MTNTVQSALTSGIRTLADAGIDNPARDARALMAHALNVSRDRITLVLHDNIDAAARRRFDQAVTERATHRPVSKIVGLRAFFGRDFRVTDDVLDPRPETEELIAQALEQEFSTVLDMGTGSGAIAVTLLAERASARAVATDISRAALDVARENAQDQRVEGRITWAHSDWWDGVSGTFDLIVSNPPYIAAQEMAALSPEVQNHDPRIALTDDADGLSCYRVIVAGAWPHLTVGGRLLVEIGPTQGPDVQQMFEAAGFAEIGIRQDLDGRDRVVFGQKRG